MSSIEQATIMYPALDDLIPYSQNFRWREVLLLHSWNIYAYPTAEVYQNIIRRTQTLEIVKNRFGGKPIVIHDFWRPELYNKVIGGAADSRHIIGDAVDFSIMTIDCDQVRNDLEPELERLGLRMEQRPGSNWVHIDGKPVEDGHSRFFWP